MAYTEARFFFIYVIIIVDVCECGPVVVRRSRVHWMASMETTGEELPFPWRPKIQVQKYWRIILEDGAFDFLLPLRDLCFCPISRAFYLSLSLSLDSSRDPIIPWENEWSTFKLYKALNHQFSNAFSPPFNFTYSHTSTSTSFFSGSTSFSFTWRTENSFLELPERPEFWCHIEEELLAVLSRSCSKIFCFFFELSQFLELCLPGYFSCTFCAGRVATGRFPGKLFGFWQFPLKYDTIPVVIVFSFY